MLRTVNWVARALGFAWLGVLAFLISPPHGPSAAPVQIAGYCLLGLGLLAWALIDLHPAAQRQRTRWLAKILVVIAVATGFASAAGSGGSALVAFTFVAARALRAMVTSAMGAAVSRRNGRAIGHWRSSSTESASNWPRLWISRATRPVHPV